MKTPEIKPDKITRPIQLLAVWLAGLVLLEITFLTAASKITSPPWLSVLLGVSAICFVPLFTILIFRMQTKYRPQMQEDPFYSKYLEREIRTNIDLDIEDRVTSRTNIEGIFRSIEEHLISLEGKIFENKEIKNAIPQEVERIKKDQERLLSEITHSLKTALHAILATTDHLYLEVERKETRSEVIVDIVERIRNSTVNANMILDTIRFQGLKQGNIQLHLCRILPMEDVIYPVVKLLRTVAQNRNLQLNITGDRELRPIVGDRGPLRTALYNIIENAIKYSYPNTTVDVKIKQDTRDLSISVVSQGISVQEHETNKIFEYGYRGKTAIQQNILGMGLGLYATREIARLHYGSVRITSPKPTITEVTLTIPSSTKSDEKDLIH